MRYCQSCGAAFQSSRTCPRDRIPTRADIDDPLLSSVLGDRYRVLERIAAGGMGQVYRAAHTRIACLFAVKVLYGDLAFDPSTLSRFLREAEVASCLQSRHIVRVVDFGQSTADVPYLVMEYLDGPTLFDVIARGGPLEPARALRIAQRILRGLAHAHERGIVHRDMKAENVILVSEDEEADIPKLLDFGVARIRERENERLTTAGIVLGTPLYMAPEQFTGEEIDARADLYALGIILFEMLRGTPPFEAPTIRGLAEKHMTEPPPDLTELIASRGGDADTNAVVARLLAKAPADRYASARDAALAIDAILGKSTAVKPAPAAPAPSAIDPQLVALLEGAIIAGAPTYNAGNHQGCASLYRRTAEEALKHFARPLACLTRLRTGLFRAGTRATATLAAWELRYAFDDLLLAAPLRNDSVRPLDREFALFATIAARRENSGHMEILGDYAVEFARALANEFRADPKRAEGAIVLDQAVMAAEKSEPGPARYAVARRALEAIRVASNASAPTSLHMDRIRVQDAPRSIPSPVSGGFAPPPEIARASQVPSRGNEVLEALVRANHLASAATNEGRYEVACRVYREALEGIGRLATNDPTGAAFAGWIGAVLTSAAKRNERDAAGVLRCAVEAILARDA